MSDSEHTTVQLKRQTHDQLADLAKKGESFDVVVQRLLAAAKGPRSS